MAQAEKLPQQDRANKGVSIRTALFGLVAVPLLALLSSLAYDTYHQYQANTAQAFQTASTLRALSATQTERFLDRARFILSDLATHPAVRALDSAHCDPLLAALKHVQPAYSNLLTLDAKGQLVCSAVEVAPGQSRGPDPKYYFNEVARTRQFTVGKPARGFITGRWVSTLAYPIQSDAGELLGVVAISVDLANYQPVVSRESVPPLTVIGIINSDATIIARSEEAQQRVGKVSDAESTRVMLRQRQGTIRSRDYHGVERFYAFAPIAGSDWITFVSLDEATVLAPVIRLAYERLAFVIALVLIVLLLTLLLLRRVAKPIEAISGTIASIASGAVHWRVQPAGPTELRRIATELNAMLDARLHAEADLRESEERYRAAFETSPDAVNINRLTDGLYLNVNDSFLKMMGWSRDHVIGKTSTELNIWRDPEDRQRLVEALQRDGSCNNLEADFVTRTGKIRTALMSARLMTLDGVPAILSVTRDITERKEAEQLIQSLAFTDALTDLPNRRMLIVRLQQAMASSERHQHHGALLLIDLDDFKSLNDSFGHHQGDRMLEQVAKRLNACIREGDTVARLGGDEFVVMLENLDADATQAAIQAEAVAEKILATLNQEYRLNDSTHHGSASIGITLFGDKSESIDEPLIRVDLALYQAKTSGRNTLRFFDPSMQVEVSARMALEAALRRAIRNHEFVLHYQVQVGAQHHATGAEALLRWQDPMHGMGSPGEFIPVAEKTGLILPIGHWVLQSACAQLAHWASQPELAHLTLAVNVSARQFRQADFVEQVLATLERTGAPAHLLKLELTESLLVTNVEDVITKMRALKAHGVGFALDDFGTGYSSLAYLKRLPLDQLKIDQGFVRDILEDSDDAAIAKTVIALARSLGLNVIAEGVETQAQCDFLAKLGCHAYQGYLFGRPLPALEFEALLVQQKR